MSFINAELMKLKRVRAIQFGDQTIPKQDLNTGVPLARI